MKLSKKLKKRTDAKCAQFVEWLSMMSNTEEHSSFYEYTREWISSVDRGGLFHVSDCTFKFFEAIELKTQKILPDFLARNSTSNKNDIVHALLTDETVQQYWWTICIDGCEEDAEELMTLIIDMWVTMRGFTITSMWMEEYKRATSKNVKKSKSLRKELQGQHED